ncbi:MAG: hypothetical protein JNM70_06640 [Anaerolineae bacterium]|nr:hypothetical protein [Anaerolineae bacterium]
MPEAPMRLAATMFIWVAFAIVAVLTIANAMFIDSVPLVFIMMVLGFSAASGTRAVWRAGSTAAPVVETEKAKRRSRLERLLDEMDSDELEQLRTRLMAENDGEQVSIEDLIQQARKDRQ